MPKVTIATAAYNVLSSCGLEAMEECVRSVAALPIEHEHIIYDGASTDGTLGALRKLEETIPTLRIVSEKDSGIYDALNKCLRDARGDYFYVLGMDDRIIDGEAFCECVAKALRTKADMLIAKVVMQDKRDVRPATMFGSCRHARMHSYSHQGVMARTALLKEYPFDQSYRITADYKQLLTLNWNGARVRMLNKKIAYCSQAGVSSTVAERCARETLKVQKEVYSLTDAETNKFLDSGFLPFRVVTHLLFVGSVFSFFMGLSVLGSYVWRKHKSDKFSTYYFLNLPIYRHLKKSVWKSRL